MLDPRIDRTLFDDLWRTIGLDPARVAQARITGHGVHVQQYATDKHGHTYLTGDGEIATRWTLLRYRDDTPVTR